MSLQYPLRHVFITQAWGANPDTYARFGYKGHNGVDYRLFDEQGNRAATAILYAPHNGTVTEARNDPNGYGNYLKIENSSEGSILAHLKSYSVKVGDTVSQGQLIGVCDNTGWSTGAHLHWGYYTLPRNRANGYGGTINQEVLTIKKIGESMPETITVNKSDWERLLNASKKGDNLINALGLRGAIADKSEAELNQLYTLKVDRDRYRDERNSAREEIKHLDYELNKISTEAKELAVELSKCQLQKDELAKQLESAKNTTGEIKIDREVKVAGQNWIINGVEVNSEGVVTANYAKK